VLELIFNFLLLPVSSFILQIPCMMNYQRRLTPPSFLWQFWAKLPGLLVSAVKFILRAHVSVFTRCLETSLCPDLEYHGPNFEATEERPPLYRATRVLSSMRWPLTSSLRITAVVSSDGFFFRILYHFLSLFFMFLFPLKYILRLFHCSSRHPNYPRFLRKMWTLKICFHVLLDLSKGE